MRLHFARHGESTANLANAFFNRGSTLPLTAKGRVQAQMLAQRMRAENLTRIYSSPLTRARQTAQIVSDSLKIPVAIHDDLREYDVGILEGQSYANGAFAEYQRVEDAWLAGNLGERITDGESAREIIARLQGVITRLRRDHSTDTVLIVAHGGLLRIALPHLLEGLPAGLPHLGHCSTAMAVEADGRLVAHSWADQSL